MIMWIESKYLVKSENFNILNTIDGTIDIKLQLLIYPESNWTIIRSKFKMHYIHADNILYVI